MDAALSFWTARRVLVCGVSSPLGAAVAELLASQGAEVSGLVAPTPGDESHFLNGRLYERIRPLAGTTRHPAPIAAALAGHEIEAIVNVTRTDARTTYALLAAARVAVPHAAITIAVVGPASRLVPMANRFRAQKRNPIAVAVVNDAIEIAGEFLLTVTKRTILRDATVLAGWTEPTDPAAARTRAA
jgi:NAD(P)-dependent dehydrogenase (short-subunit alcohol dehydrogenase family)